MKCDGLKKGVWSVLLLFCLVCGGCVANNGKQKLCQTLYSPYTAQANVVLGSGEQAVVLEARITKSNESTRMDILSPLPYAGISAESVCGSVDRLSLAYDGVRAELPKGALEGMGLVLELTSDPVVNVLERLPASDFVLPSDTDEAHTASVSFTQGPCAYRVEYDPANGTPVLLGVQTQTQNIEIRILKFKPETPPS